MMPEPMEGLSPPVQESQATTPESVSTEPPESAPQPTPAVVPPPQPTGPQYAVGLTADDLRRMGVDTPEKLEQFKKLHPDIVQEGISSAIAKQRQAQAEQRKSSLTSERKELERFLNDYVSDCREQGYEPTPKDILLAQHTFTKQRAKDELKAELEQEQHEKQTRLSKAQEAQFAEFKGVVFDKRNEDIFGTQEEIQQRRYRNPAAVAEFDKMIQRGAKPENAMWLIREHIMPYLSNTQQSEPENVLPFRPQMGTAGLGSAFFDTPNNMGKAQPRDEHATAHEVLKRKLDQMKKLPNDKRGDALLNMFD